MPVIYLGGRPKPPRRYRSTLRCISAPEGSRISGEQPSLTGLRELSTSDVHDTDVATDANGLLPRFLTLTSPMPRKAKEGRLFSSALICPRGQLPVRKRSALCCPDFPHAPPGRMRQTARLVSKISLSGGKITIFMADKRQIRGKNVLLQGIWFCKNFYFPLSMKRISPFSSSWLQPRGLPLRRRPIFLRPRTWRHARPLPKKGWASSCTGAFTARLRRANGS